MKQFERLGLKTSPRIPLSTNLIVFFFLFFCIKSYSQTEDYTYVSAEVKSPSSVIITLKTFAPKKKTVDFEARCAALRIAMFDGINGTIYSKPLLSQGTIALSQKANYFEHLFNNRLAEVIKNSTMKSDFKKAEKGEKSTLYTIELNYIQLKKDLEKNNIKKQIGL